MGQTSTKASLLYLVLRPKSAVVTKQPDGAIETNRKTSSRMTAIKEMAVVLGIHAVMDVIKQLRHWINSRINLQRHLGRSVTSNCDQLASVHVSRTELDANWNSLHDNNVQHSGICKWHFADNRVTDYSLLKIEKQTTWMFWNVYCVSWLWNYTKW